MDNITNVVEMLKDLFDRIKASAFVLRIKDIIFKYKSKVANQKDEKIYKNIWSKIKDIILKINKFVPIYVVLIYAFLFVVILCLNSSEGFDDQNASINTQNIIISTTDEIEQSIESDNESVESNDEDNNTTTTEIPTTTSSSTSTTTTTTEMPTITTTATTTTVVADQMFNIVFSKTDMLENVVVNNVLGISGNIAIIQVTENGDSVIKCYDLKKGKLFSKVKSIYDFSEIDEGKFIYYDNNGGLSYFDKGITGNINVPADNVNIYKVFLDKQKYLAFREVFTQDYSGYEYSLISFDGMLEYDWLRCPTYNSDWSYMGNGMFYIGYIAEENQDTSEYCYYIFDAFNGKMFNWPVIMYMEDEYERKKVDFSYFTMGLGHNGYTANYDDFYLHGISEYTDDKCMVYLQFSEYGGSPLVFFEVDRKGNLKQVSEISSVRDLHYIEEKKEFICTSYLTEFDYYKEFTIKDMYGKVIIDLSKEKVTYYDISDSFIVIGTKNQSGIVDTIFYTIYDFRGNMVHKPFHINNCNLFILDSIDGYGYIDTEGLKVFNMDDKMLLSVGSIEVKEKGLIFTKKYTYFPIGIEIYDGYYSVNYFNTEEQKYRDFIYSWDIK